MSDVDERSVRTSLTKFWIGGISLLFLIPFGIFWCSSYVANLPVADPRPITFDQGKWSKGSEWERFAIAEDIIAQDRLKGMQNADVRQLLGKPDAPTYQSDYDTLYYNIGPIAKDSEDILIVHCSRGRVTTCEIMRNR